MFERFTNRARHVVVLSQEEARRLRHNYIGTEHILLGLMGESGGIASQALVRFGMSLDGTRDDVKSIIGLGKSTPTGHIPFTPRAKKVLELALREALQLNNDFIGTEHILLGVIREGEGVGAQIIMQHSSGLEEVRAAVLDVISTMPTRISKGRRWLRRRAAEASEAVEAIGSDELRASPAADASLAEAARLAGSQPVGSHHLLLAAIADSQSAASRALTELGVELEPLKVALRNTDVTGTSDEQPEQAGRRQMVITVTPEKVTVEATDQLIIGLGQSALAALGDETGVIQGSAPAAATLSNVWQALHDSLEAIQQRPATPPDSPGRPDTEAA